MFVHAALCVIALSLPASGGITPATSNGGSSRGRIIDDAPEIAKLVDAYQHSLRSRTGGRGRDMQGALAALLELDRLFSRSGPNDRERIVQNVVLGFDRLDTNHPDQRGFLISAAKAMADMGPESVQPLTELVVDRKVEADAALHRQLILSLGRTRHVDGLKVLQGLLHHEDSGIEAASAEALGEFRYQDQERRKELFYLLLGRLLDEKGLVEQDDFNLTARRRYDTIVGAITTSLQRLSGLDEHDPEAWQRFWNKNKNKPWKAVTLGA
ncbi:MAG: hypothetical protein ACI8TQ_002312 [Planctomycetota bacterium]|jgi:hypothetical protein